MGGFTTFVLIAVLIQRLSSYHWVTPADTFDRITRLKPWLIMGIVVVAVQIFLGGWIASNYAAFGCPPKEFPTCYGSYWPEMDFIHGFNFAQHIGPNYLGGLLHNEARTAIHYVHRIGALVTTLYLGLLFVLCWRIGHAALTKLAGLMLITLVIQVILGISNVIMVMPLSIAVAHNMVGAILLAVVASIATQCARAKAN